MFGETIANPALTVLDIELFAKVAHAHGVPMMVDNTFPTPVNCRPIEWGADIVTHSTTKYMDGHGAALGGAIAVCLLYTSAGAADGLGCGDNTKAALITRGIAEMSRLGVAMGGHIETFNGLTGIGDLIVTCASMHSRNRRAGILIGQGKTCLLYTSRCV